MKVIDTSTLTPDDVRPMAEDLWIYNGLDCCVTMEVFEAISPQLPPKVANVYALSRAMMAPILEMNMRGVLIDQEMRHKLQQEYTADITRMGEHLSLIIKEVFELPNFNWKSNDQLKHLFYTVMQIPPIRKKNGNGQMVPTVDRSALEKLQYYHYAKPIVAHLSRMRDLQKRLEMLATSVDRDNRIRTSYNIAGTNTGRLSSSFSDFGSGRNLQNIEERLRRIFVADPGYKFANIDLEQADSRNIGALIFKYLNDPTYLDACESGDLHTTVAKLSMPELPWTGNIKEDKAYADSYPFYRRDSLRQGCKKIGHGSNYYGKPFGIAQVTGIDKKIIEGFQKRYFAAFPGIPAYHQWVARQLKVSGVLENIFERPRHFAGRASDESTLREAIAFTGQSSTAEFINYAMLNVWKLNNCQLLLQVHDSLLLQYPEDREDEILPVILNAMKVVNIIHGRPFSIPVEAKVGWNWSNYSETNPDGLKKYGGNDARRRDRQPRTSFLDRGFL